MPGLTLWFYIVGKLELRKGICKKKTSIGWIRYGNGEMRRVGVQKISLRLDHAKVKTEVTTPYKQGDAKLTRRGSNGGNHGENHNRGIY